MSDRKPSPFPILLNNDVCSLIQADENVYQVRFKNRAANAYVVRGKSRTIMVDVGLTSMDMVNLMLGVEAEFDFTIPQEQITPENFQSVQTLERLVAEQLQAA